MSSQTSFLDHFLEGIGSQHTRRAYRSDLIDFLDFHAGDPSESQIAEVTKQDVRAYVRSLQSDGKSVSTQRRRLSALRRLFDWLLDRGTVEGNPARACRVDVSPPAEASDRSRDHTSPVLSKAEVETLVGATDDAGESAVRDRALILTILYGALRRAEVAAMNVEHVRPLGRHWVIDLPSGDGWAGAYVKVPETVVDAIEATRSRYGIDEGALWRSLSNRNRGARMTPDAIYKAVRRTGRRAGLGAVTIDTLRQTGLRLAMDAGATLQQVQSHGRLKSAGSVERFADTDDQENRLGDGAVDFVDLEV
jgi:site-specific recombinase XerD